MMDTEEYEEEYEEEVVEEVRYKSVVQVYWQVLWIENWDTTTVSSSVCAYPNIHDQSWLSFQITSSQYHP